MYRRALAYFRPDAGRVAVTVGLIAVASALSLLQAYPFAVLADCVFGRLPATGPVYRAMLWPLPSSKGGQVVGLAVELLLLRVGQELIAAAHTMLNIRVGYAGLVRVRAALFDAWQRQELAWHRGRPAGDAVYRLVWDAAAFHALLNTAVTTVAVNVAMLVVMAGVMLGQSVRLTLVAAAIGPPLVWVVRRYETVLRDRSADARAAEADLAAEAGRFAVVIGVVQQFGQQAAAAFTFCHKARVSAQTYLRLHRREVAFWLLTGLTFAAGSAAVFGVGGRLVLHDQFGDHPDPAGMTLGKLSIFLAYAAMLFGPLRALSGATGQAASAAAGVRRVFEVIDRPPTIVDGPAPLPIRPRTLSLDGVSFRYTADGPDVLDRVWLTVAPGELIAIVGRSGVGKTTLLGLLPRLHDPTAGTVRLDGHDLRQCRLADVRRHVAVVSQEPVLLPTTVRENVRYGRPDATDADVRRAIDLADAAFAHALPAGLDTPVADGGATLSGGQRQRLAIARALLADAPILVLDEPTGGVDAEQEAALVRTIRSLRGSRTVVVVSHRPGMIAGCDRVVPLVDGRIGGDRPTDRSDGIGCAAE